MEVFEFFPEGDPTHPEAFGGFGFVPLSLLKGFHDASFLQIYANKLSAGQPGYVRLTLRIVTAQLIKI